MDQYSLYVSENEFTLRLYSGMYIVLLHCSCFCFCLFKSWFGNRYLERECLDWPTKHTGRRSTEYKTINAAINVYRAAHVCISFIELSSAIKTETKGKKLCWSRCVKGKEDKESSFKVKCCEWSSPPGGGIYQLTVVRPTAGGNIMGT